MFIVLEGVDGSGKSTQIAKLREMFAQKGIPTEYLHFPRFDAPYFGDLIARFLRGELGSIEQVDPYVVAMLYAGDRRDAAAMIRGWIADGKVIASGSIADGYDSLDLDTIEGAEDFLYVRAEILGDGGMTLTQALTIDNGSEPLEFVEKTGTEALLEDIITILKSLRIGVIFQEIIRAFE